MQPAQRITLILAVIVSASSSVVAQQSQQSSSGWMAGLSGGVALMDASYFGGIEPRAQIWVHVTNWRPNKFGPDLSVFFVPMEVIGSSIALGGDLGVSYQFGGAKWWLAGGGSALIPTSDDFLPGGYVGLTWMPSRVSSRFAVFAHLRQHLYVRQGDVLLYPSLAIGLTTVPMP